MSCITRRVQIEAPPEQVWQVLADFGGVQSWAPAVVDCRCPTAVTRGMGAKRILTTSRGDITEETVVAWDEGRGFTFEIPDGLPPVIEVLRETWSVQDAITGTDVIVVMDYHARPGLINATVGSLIAGRVLSRMLAQNLAGLKQHVETGVGGLQVSG